MSEWSTVHEYCPGCGHSRKQVRRQLTHATEYVCEVGHQTYQKGVHIFHVHNVHPETVAKHFPETIGA